MPFIGKTKSMTSNAGLTSMPQDQIGWVRFLQELEIHLDKNITSKLSRPVTKFKNVTQTKSEDTTLANDSDLFGWAVEPNKKYIIESFLSIFQNVGDFKWKFSFDSPPQSTHGIQRAIDQGSNIADDYLLDAITVSQSITTMTDSQQYGLVITAMFTSHATKQATMDFQWAQDTSSSNITNLVNNSWIRLTQLGSATF